MPKNYEPEEVGGINIIAAGTTFTGDIVSKGDCRVDGTFKGNIISNSKIFIGKTGMVEGVIKCQSIEIEGQAKANISAAELLSLKTSAVLAGNINISKIAIEPGANFEGNCVMRNNSSSSSNSSSDSSSNSISNSSSSAQNPDSDIKN
jgi:cytoskeletal protein CcmA (bactofilin family)